MIGKEKDHEIQIPVRVVMNNYTLTAFSGFKFSDMRKSFHLSKSKIYGSLDHKNCFVAQESERNVATFCDFGFESSENFFQEWNYDFNLFKYQCHEKNEAVNVTFAKEMEENLKKLKVCFLIFIFISSF